MEVTLSLLADSANISQEGKLNILGEFNNINASSFPVVLPSMMLVLRFRAERVEIGQEKQLEIRLSDPDGAELGKANATFVVPDAPPGRRVNIGNILPIQMAAFPRAGDYRFDVMINGDQKADVQLTITDTSQEPKDADSN